MYCAHRTGTCTFNQSFTGHHLSNKINKKEKWLNANSSMIVSMLPYSIGLHEAYLDFNPFTPHAVQWIVFAQIPVWYQICKLLNLSMIKRKSSIKYFLVLHALNIPMMYTTLTGENFKPIPIQLGVLI